jgi:hypothetical protein
MKLDVLKSKGPWYAEGLSFTCTQCGNCCTGGPGYVWISKAEVGRLAEFLKVPAKDVLKQYTRRLGSRVSLNEHQNHRGEYDCTFLKEIPTGHDDEGKVVQTRRVCTIYPVRPLQCRTWPFWDGLLATPGAWEGAIDRCPGMNRGRKFSFEQIETLRTAKDWPDRPPGSQE